MVNNNQNNDHDDNVGIFSALITQIAYLYMMASMQPCNWTLQSQLSDAHTVYICVCVCVCVYVCVCVCVYVILDYGGN